MKIYAIVCTLVALVFLALFLGTIPVALGGGQGVPSPDGAFQATAISRHDKNPLALGRQQTYYEFTVTRGYTTPFKKVVFYPSETNDGMDFRSLPTIIAWAPDSSEVTFTIPGATLKLDMRDHPQWKQMPEIEIK
ncbi:MAG: hypothetical protein KDK97_02780 [Verrucomicrobiales bacterium]|nr:hypothetical protein [Verrucomicrobiales bacterium]MCP5560644.1 hypothetical protein [Verrucomicrobiaceae bacterium]